MAGAHTRDEKAVKGALRTPAFTSEKVASKHTSKRRESTSPDEGIAYSPAEIDDSPSSSRRNKLSELEGNHQVKPDYHIEITIEGGLQGESKKNSKQSKASRHRTSAHANETSVRGKVTVQTTENPNIIDRGELPRVRKKRASSNKISKMTEKTVAKHVVKNALIENSLAKKNKPVWVEIAKRRSDSATALRVEKPSQNTKGYRIDKSTDGKEKNKNNAKLPVMVRQRNDQALKVRHKNDKTDSQNTSVHGHTKGASGTKKERPRRGEVKSTEENGNAAKIDKRRREKTIRTPRRFANGTKPENTPSAASKRVNGGKGSSKHRSVSMDSSVRDLSYSSSSSASSSASNSRYSSSATSGTHSVSSASVSSESSRYSSSLTSSSSSSSSVTHAAENSSHPRSKLWPQGKSAEKLQNNRTSNPYQHRHDVQTKGNGSHYQHSRKKTHRSDKSKTLHRRHSHGNARKHGADAAEVRELRTSRKAPKDVDRAGFEDDQEFDVNLERRRNRPRRRAADDEEMSGNISQRTQWQHQRLVMTSLRPAENARSSEKLHPTQETSQPQKQKTFEATSKDAAGSALTIRDLYSLHHVLSDTQNGTVIAGHRRSDGMRVAIKRIAKSGTTRWGWMNGKVVPLELALICQVNETRHAGVVEIVEWHETTEAFLLVMVRPHPSVDLYDYVTKQKRLKEPVARRIIRQLVLALLHCQKMGVLHRDVKLENILFNPDSKETILIDFGCGDYNRNGPYKEFAGTPEYYPPEWFLCKQYGGEAATVWSVGVLLYSLLCGTLPFRSSKDIINKELTKYPADISRVAKHLIGETVSKNPRERIGLRALLEHPWLRSSKDHPEDRMVMTKEKELVPN